MFGGQIIDLIWVYCKVVSAGGYDVVNGTLGGWSALFKQLPSGAQSETSGSYRLKRAYERLLLEYERRMGEGWDPHDPAPCFLGVTTAGWEPPSAGNGVPHTVHKVGQVPIKQFDTMPLVLPDYHRSNKAAGEHAAGDGGNGGGAGEADGAAAAAASSAGPSRIQLTKPTLCVPSVSTYGLGDTRPKSTPVDLGDEAGAGPGSAAVAGGGGAGYAALPLVEYAWCTPEAGAAAGQPVLTATPEASADASSWALGHLSLCLASYKYGVHQTGIGRQRKAWLPMCSLCHVTRKTVKLGETAKGGSHADGSGATAAAVAGASAGVDAAADQSMRSHDEKHDASAGDEEECTGDDGEQVDDGDDADEADEADGDEQGEEEGEDGGEEEAEDAPAPATADGDEAMTIGAALEAKQAKHQDTASSAAPSATSAGAATDISPASADPSAAVASDANDASATAEAAASTSSRGRGRGRGRGGRGGGRGGRGGFSSSGAASSLPPLGRRAAPFRAWALCAACPAATCLNCILPTPASAGVASEAEHRALLAAAADASCRVGACSPVGARLGISDLGMWLCRDCQARQGAGQAAETLTWCSCCSAPFTSAPAAALQADSVFATAQLQRERQHQRPPASWPPIVKCTACTSRMHAVCAWSTGAVVAAAAATPLSSAPGDVPDHFVCGACAGAAASTSTSPGHARVSAARPSVLAATVWHGNSTTKELVLMGQLLA